MGWRGVALQILGLPLAWLGLIYMQQDSLIYHPRRYKTQARREDAVLHRGMTTRWVEFATAADGNQSAILLRRRAAKIRRVYLVFGGNAMVAKDWLGILAAQDAPWADDLAFLLVDYPGFGHSEGTPSQASIRRASEAAMEQVAAALGAGDDNDDLRFGSIGHSIGCAAALQLAAQLEGGQGGEALGSSSQSKARLTHVVLSAPFTSLALEAQAALPVLKLVPAWLIARLAARNEWDNLEAARQLGTQRVDIIHGTEDSIVPHDMGQALWTHLRSLGIPASFKSVVADHNDLLGTQTYLQWLEAVLDRVA